MPVLLHIADARNGRSIHRAGLRPGRRGL